MLRRITAKQFKELLEFEALEPSETIKDDYRSASIREMIFNMAVSKSDRRPIADFLLKWESEPKKPQTWQEKISIMHMVAAAHVAALASPVEAAQPEQLELEQREPEQLTLLVIEGG